MTSPSPTPDDGFMSTCTAFYIESEGNGCFSSFDRNPCVAACMRSGYSIAPSSRTSGTFTLSGQRPSGCECPGGPLERIPNEASSASGQFIDSALGQTFFFTTSLPSGSATPRVELFFSAQQCSLFVKPTSRCLGYTPSEPANGVGGAPGALSGGAAAGLGVGLFLLGVALGAVLMFFLRGRVCAGWAPALATPPPQSVADWGRPASAAAAAAAPPLPQLPAGWTMQSDGTVGGTFYVEPSGARHWPSSLKVSS